MQGALLIRTHLFDHLQFPILTVLLALGLFLGLWTVFTWSIHRGTPFFLSRPPRQRRIINESLMLLPALAATFGLLQLLCVDLMPFGSPPLSRFPLRRQPRQRDLDLR
jgi:hypothetical protein